MIGQTERIDIKGVVIEVPKNTGGKFDPVELDIVKKDYWTRFLADFLEQKGYENITLSVEDDASYLLTQAFYLISLYPQKRTALGLAANDFEKWNQAIGPDTVSTIHEIYFRSVFPSFVRKFNLAEREKLLHNYFNQGVWGAYDHRDVAPIELLDPGKGRKLFELAREAFRVVQGEDLLSTTQGIYYRTIFTTAEAAASLKILGINDPHINAEFWRKAYDTINNVGTEDEWRMQQFLFDLRVLAADDIKFGENGLELIMDESRITNEISPLPEVRRF